jgi:myo-inositol-1(or 4)-monophosphatase
MTQEAEEFMKIAAEMARSAGDVVRDGAAASRFAITSKSSATDHVTDVDKASEAFIVNEISARRPDDGILGEEGSSKESKSGVVWTIDPIDGTTNFIYGLPNYAVSIGVSVNGVPTAGAVYNPTRDEMFNGALGHGAYLNDQPIHVNDTTDLSLALVATGFAYSAEIRREQGKIVAELLPDIRDIRRYGSSALDVCNVACGRVDAYYEVNVFPWDVAASMVILREAGGIITGFTDESPSPKALAACTTEIYEALRERVVTQQG